MRQHGLGRPAALAGGLLLALGGSMASATSMVLLVTTVVWTPWLLSTELDALDPFGG